MLGGMKVLGGVLVLGRIAASHVTAGEAQPKVYPTIPHLDALLADVDLGLRNVNLIQMSAYGCHGCLLY
jgi:hypothetical protein